MPRTSIGKIAFLGFWVTALGCGGRADLPGSSPQATPGGPRSSTGAARPEPSTSGSPAPSPTGDGVTACPGIPYIDEGGVVCVGSTSEVSPPAPCETDIPDAAPGSSGVNYDATRYLFDPVAGQPFEVPLLATERDCNDSEVGGFYFSAFDELDKPKRLVLCPCSCAAINETRGTYQVLFSCLGGWPRPD